MVVATILYGDLKTFYESIPHKTDKNADITLKLAVFLAQLREKQALLQIEKTKLVDIYPILLNISKIYCTQCNQPDYILSKVNEEQPYGTWSILQSKKAIGLGDAVPYASFSKIGNESLKTKLFYMAQRANICTELCILFRHLLVMHKNYTYKGQKVRKVFVSVCNIDPRVKNPQLINQDNKRVYLKHDGEDATHAWFTLEFEDGKEVHIDLSADQFGVHTYVSDPTVTPPSIPYYEGSKPAVKVVSNLRRERIGINDDEEQDKIDSIESNGLCSFTAAFWEAVGYVTEMDFK